MIPGPREGTSRPSLNTTPRSYSCNTLIPLAMSTITNKTTTMRLGMGYTSSRSRSGCCPLDLQGHSLHADHLDHLAHFHVLRGLALGVPVLAVHPDLATR